MEFDLHIHSDYSPDSLLSLDKIISIAIKRGLSGIAITDHYTIKGAKEIGRTANDKLLIICGQEIGTEIGDVLGLFLQDEIKSHSFVDIIKEIKEQNGLSILAHPFKEFDAQLPLELINKVDLIEVCNGRMGNYKSRRNKKAQMLANELHLPASAGSDAHFGNEIGHARCAFENISSAEALKDALLHSNRIVSGNGSSGFLRLLSVIVRKSRKYVRSR
jgi:predicted metal-dependent phosphoesterase TrpH